MINISGVRGYEYSETIADGANGESIYVHPVLNASGGLSCTVVAGANTGKFQFSTSSKAEIEADTATWQDWDNGTVSGTSSDVLDAPVTGIRGVSVSGEIKIEVVV